MQMSHRKAKADCTCELGAFLVQRTQASWCSTKTSARGVHQFSIAQREPLGAATLATWRAPFCPLVFPPAAARLAKGIIILRLRQQVTIRANWRFHTRANQTDGPRRFTLDE